MLVVVPSALGDHRSHPGTFWLYSGLNAMRNVPILLHSSPPPILAEHLSPVGEAWRDSPWSRWFRRVSNDAGTLSRAAGGNGLVATVMAVTLFVLAKPMLVGGHPIVKTEISANRFPVATVDYLRTHPETVHGGDVQRGRLGWLPRPLPAGT